MMHPGEFCLNFLGQKTDMLQSPFCSTILYPDMANTCDALVVSCIDFRFQKYIRNWLDNKLAHKTFDYVGFAGGVKNLDIILEQLAISVGLHTINDVILMNHEECGAYGTESTPENHARDLRHAKEIIHQKYPHLTIETYYLHLDGTFESVA